MKDVQDDAELPATPAPEQAEPGQEPTPEPGSEPDPAPEQAPDQAQERPEPVQLRLRRAPRYRAFGLTGVVIGVVIGLILAFSRAAESDYSQQTIAGYFAASFGMVGALLGLGAALIADRRRR